MTNAVVVRPVEPGEHEGGMGLFVDDLFSLPSLRDQGWAAP